MFSTGPAGLLVGVLLGALGVGYVMYAKRSAEIMPLLCGMVLIIFPMFASSIWVLVAVGAVVAALPFVGTRMGWW